MKKILYLIQQAGVLMQMPRSHVKHLGNTYDNVASHSHHVSVIAYCISRMEGLAHEEGLKCVGMAVFHDLVEARTSDLDFIAKHYAKVDEGKAVKDQVSKIKFGKDIQELISEYEDRKTKLSLCARDADSLAQMFIEWNLMWQGNKIAQKWFESDFNDRVPGFKTESATKLAFALKESHPNEWWWSQFMEDDAAIDTEKLFGKKS